MIMKKDFIVLVKATEYCESFFVKEFGNDIMTKYLFVHFVHLFIETFWVIFFYKNEFLMLN